MSELIKERKLDKPDLKSWMDTITGWKEKYPFKYEKGKHISSQEAVEALYEVSKGEAIMKYPKVRQLLQPVLVSTKCGRPNIIVTKNQELISPHSDWARWALVILLQWVQKWPVLIRK